MYIVEIGKETENAPHRNAQFKCFRMRVSTQDLKKLFPFGKGVP